jgi:bifunctional DNA-binding transcriptional regulator/antitoxin component of YhaV-PrlF toxin-antitoxin module
MVKSMGNAISTITSKWQITIPEDVRKEMPLKVGQRMAWEVEGDKLVGRPVRSISELSGSLRPEGAATKGNALPGAFAEAAMARHARISKQKP